MTARVAHGSRLVGEHNDPVDAAGSLAVARPSRPSAEELLAAADHDFAAAEEALATAKKDFAAAEATGDWELVKQCRDQLSQRREHVTACIKQVTACINLLTEERKARSAPSSFSTAGCDAAKSPQARSASSALLGWFPAVFCSWAGGVVSSPEPKHHKDE